MNLTVRCAARRLSPALYVLARFRLSLRSSISEIFVMSTAKDELRALLESQPEDSSTEELVRELAFHVMVQKGLADSDARRVITNKEMERRIQSWGQ